MANIKKTKDDAMSIINAALTIIDRFPEFDITNTDLSFNTSTNPFTFLMDLFKKTAGYNVFLKIITRFIVISLPVVETSVKAVILSNIKNMLACSLNPFITEDILREGIVFDLRLLDLLNKLNYSPFDKIGKYYYFGCDGFKSTSDLINAGDFDAFLWYVKNKSNRRQVWYGVNLVDTYTDSSDAPAIVQKSPKSDPPAQGNSKCNKDNGIITLKYCERPSSLRNADCTGRISYLQTPHHNCLQVFIGNTQDTVGYANTLEAEIKSIDQNISGWKADIEQRNIEIAEITKEIEELERQFAENKIDKNTYNDLYSVMTNHRDDISYAITELNANINNAINDVENGKRAKIAHLKSLETNNFDNPQNYRTIQQNYYYNHTLLEFNTDYIMSLKLFDSKNLAAQLIDCLTGCLTVNLHLSYEQMLVKQETQKMVQSIVETDDAVVSDCFFTFSNADYDKMLQKAELAREGLYSTNTFNPTGAKIDAEVILDKLNNINEGSSKETIQSVIEGSLTEISKTMSDTSYDANGGVNLGAEINFIENIMNNLAYVITLAVLSPKLYLLIGVNLRLLGKQPNFNINSFIDENKQMMVNILRSVRDTLVQYLVDELMKILVGLAREVSVKMAVEQAQYYSRLINRLISCIKSSRGDDDETEFNIDDVNYADIIQETEEPKNNEC